jgi:fructose-1,6-bisphosphatase/inositol monophosphatase family enzyme
MHNDIRNEVSSAVIDEIYNSVRLLTVDATALVRKMVSERFSREMKKDQSFVTEVDFAVEDLIRSFVTANFPDHGIVGEERDDVRPDADFQWITDPIDGTQNLVHGVPTYGIVIGVHYKGRPVAGAISHPMLDLEYVGALGKGTFSKGRQVIIDDSELVDGVTIDPQEILALSTRACFERNGEGALFDSLMKEHPSTRVYYDIFSTTRVIEGQIGGLLEFGMKIWDIAATEILVTEAGGRFETVRTIHNPGGYALVSILAGKPSIVEALLEKVGGKREYSL